MSAIRKVFHAVLSLLFVACTNTAQAESEPIKMGAVLILSNAEAMYGIAFREGIEIAVAEVNAAGGIKGRPIEVIYEDSKNIAVDAHKAASKLINSDKILINLDSSFTEVMANGPLFEKARIPNITLWDSAKQIEELGDYNFGIGIYTPSAGMESAEFARQHLHAKTCVVINMQNEWSDAVTKVFSDHFTELGGKVLKVISLDPTTTDFRTVLTQARGLKPDFLYTPMVEGILPFYTQIKQLGIKQPIVTSDVISQDHIDAKPEVFEGIYQTQARQPENPISKKFTEAYRQRFGKDPGMLLFSAWGYDAVKLYALAIEQVGAESEKIKDYLYTVKDFQGASGTIAINAAGSSPTMEHMFRIQGSKFVLVD